MANANPTDDHDILGLARDGRTDEAVRLLVRRYGDVVACFCRRMVHDASHADDVCQQVFIEAYRDLPRFARRSSLRTWLLGIARHRALDALRTRRRCETRTEDHGIDELAHVPDPGPTPAESFEDKQLLWTLRACLRELGEGTRMSVFLRFDLDCSFDEISRICGESPGAHHARVSRALRQLRLQIEARIQEPPGVASSQALTAAERPAADRIRKAS